MATAQTIIDRALRLIGAIASGESPTAQESTDALTALNNMIESWQTERLFCYGWVDTAETLVPGDNAYTIGSSTPDISVSPRPDSLKDVYIRESNIDYPVKIIDVDRWNAIADKTSSSNIPEFAYYNQAYPNGTIYLWPTPSAANVMHVVTWQVIGSLATTATAVSLPPGYERALSHNLAIEIAPEYEKQVSGEVQAIAQESKASIKRSNNRNPITSYTELGLMTGRRSNIEADQP